MKSIQYIQASLAKKVLPDSWLIRLLASHYENKVGITIHGDECMKPCCLLLNLLFRSLIFKNYIIFPPGPCHAAPEGLPPAAPHRGHLLQSQVGLHAYNG